MKDLFGKAILDYQTNNSPEDIITETSISEADELPVEYLFRPYEKMPELEQLALKLSRGHVLDVGCGAGSHSLYLQDFRKLNVSAIDISSSAIKACKLRGLKNASAIDLMSIEGKFDTILLLMNGAGMCGKIRKMPAFLRKLKSLLSDGGQILMDSSDIIYMFDEDDQGGKLLADPQNYYGEVKYMVSYKGQAEEPFDWLYIDFDKLHDIAAENGLKCELISKGDHFDYLARLS